MRIHSPNIKAFAKALQVLLCAGAGLFFGLSHAQAFTQVTLSTSAPASIEDAFIAFTTTYFNAKLVKNPLASRTYAITLNGVNQHPPLSGNSFTDCISQGFSDGMDAERLATLKLISAEQNMDISSQTCSGTIQSTETLQACQFIYNSIGNSIAQRWLAVYTSTGGVVVP